MEWNEARNGIGKLVNQFESFGDIVLACLYGSAGCRDLWHPEASDVNIILVTDNPQIGPQSFDHRLDRLDLMVMSTSEFMGSLERGHPRVLSAVQTGIAVHQMDDLRLFDAARRNVERKFYVPQPRGEFIEAELDLVGENLSAAIFSYFSDNCPPGITLHVCNDALKSVGALYMLYHHHRLATQPQQMEDLLPELADQIRGIRDASRANYDSLYKSQMFIGDDKVGKIVIDTEKRVHEFMSEFVRSYAPHPSKQPEFISVNDFMMSKTRGDHETVLGVEYRFFPNNLMMSVTVLDQEGDPVTYDRYLSDYAKHLAINRDDHSEE